MKLFLIQAEHWTDPGTRMAIAFTPAAADAQALAWVNDLLADVQPGASHAFDEDGDAKPPAPVPAGGDWKAGLHALADAILVERGYPREPTEDIAVLVDDRETELPSVWIAEVPLVGLPGDQPRIVIACEGGLVSGVVTDMPMDVTIIDYDVEGDSDPDTTVEVPQDGGPRTATARRGGETPEVDPDFITRVLALPTDAQCLALDDEADKAQEVDESKWLISAEIGLPGPEGGTDSYSGYFAGETADQALEAGRRIIRHMYAEGVRIFSMKALAPSNRGEKA